MSTPVQLTMLNGMAGQDFDEAAARHAELGLKWLDLKDSLYGQTVNDLSRENARKVAEVAEAHGLKVYCLSSGVGHSALDEGEEAYRARHFVTLENVLRVADVLRPQVVRLLGATVATLPPPGETRLSLVARQFPWAFDVYRDLIDRIVAEGYQVGIENETGNCILGSVADVLGFFEWADPDGKAHFIYDVQNLWQTGTFPTPDVYRALKPRVGGFHLKGGRSEDGRTLKWASALEEASWPVAEIVREVVADGVAPVLCLNPSHGEKPDGYNLWEVTQRDVAFLRRSVSGIE